MRIRTVKPAFWTSPDVTSLPIPTRLHFIGLWNYSDDHGRGVDDVRLIKAALWPMDDKVTTRTVESMQAELARQGVIERYEVAGRRYFAIRSWPRHQRVDRPQPSTIPLSARGDDSTNGPRTVADDSALARGIIIAGREGKGEGREGKGIRNGEREQEHEPDGFGAFWNAYPRKVEKAGARRKFASLLAGGADPEEIIAGASRYAADPNREDGYTKHPTTWLNNGCWSDAAIPSKVSASGNVGNILALADRAEGA